MMSEKPEDLEKCQAYWIVGKSGAGKSQLVRNLGYDYFEKKSNKFWDGYNNEPLVFIDDITWKSAWRLKRELEIWTDRYAFQAEFKNKNKNRFIRPKVIIITSNISLDNCVEYNLRSFGCIGTTFNNCLEFELTNQNREIIASNIIDHIKLK